MLTFINTTQLTGTDRSTEKTWFETGLNLQRALIEKCIEKCLWSRWKFSCQQNVTVSFKTVAARHKFSISFKTKNIFRPFFFFFLNLCYYPTVTLSASYMNLVMFERLTTHILWHQKLEKIQAERNTDKQIQWQRNSMDTCEEMWCTINRGWTGCQVFYPREWRPFCSFKTYPVPRQLFITLKVLQVQLGWPKSHTTRVCQSDRNNPSFF